MRTLTLSLLLAAAVFAQGSPVSLVTSPPPAPTERQFFYDASSNLQYVCVAAQRGATTTVTREATTLTSIAVATNVGTVTTSSAHGLYVGARVIITGATVDTDLNGTYTVATVGSTTTYTIATTAVADATYTESTLVVSTSYPLLTAAVWAIQALTYNASNLLTGSYWANASTGYGLACTTRTSY